MRSELYFLVESLFNSIENTRSEVGARILDLFSDYPGKLEVTINTPGVTDSDWPALAEIAHRYKTPVKAIGPDMLAKTLDEQDEAVNNLYLNCATELTKELPRIISKTKLEIGRYLGNLEGEF